MSIDLWYKYLHGEEPAGANKATQKERATQIPPSWPRGVPHFFTSLQQAGVHRALHVLVQPKFRDRPNLNLYYYNDIDRTNYDMELLK